MLYTSAETDWLGSRPIFYNEKTLKISDNINEVIDFSDLEFHPEGFNNYLRYGYTVFGQTIVKNVKALRYSSSIRKENNQLIIDEKEDPVKQLYRKGYLKGNEVIELIIESIKQWENQKDAPVLLPLSGGNDSKLLAFSLKNYKDVYAYSYGYSRKQYDFFEVVKAQKVADYCGIEWKHIPIGDFHNKKYYSEWNDIFGVSVHSHGEYQMEFYDSILKRNPLLKGGRVLSGIIGDVWAGNVRCKEVETPRELVKLGYTHGMCADENISLLKDDRSLEEQFYKEHKEELKEENWRIIYAMRFKIMLLSYLCIVPEKRGFDVWSPFLDMNIAMDMVNLSWEEKKERKWQTDFFEKYDLEYGWLKKECDYNSNVNYLALRRNPLEPLDVDLLKRYVKKEYIEYINRILGKKPIQKCAAKPRTIKNIYNKVINYYDRQFWTAEYKGYRILKPIEYLLKKQEAIQFDRM